MNLKNIFFIIFIMIFSSQVSAEKGKSYKDWRQACESSADSGTEVCHIFQSLTTKDNGQLILNVAVGHLPSKADATAIFTLPLGVSLLSGVVVQIDEGEKHKLKYSVCNVKGCLAAMVLNTRLINKLKAGSHAKVNFFNVQGKGFTVKVSLRGFTAGFNSLRKL